MIIKPNTALITEEANPVTAARFPCCAHFWQCKETSGLTLVDAMGACDLIADSMTFGTNYVDPVATSAAFSGTFTTIGTTPFIMIEVYDSGGTAQAANFGDGSTTDTISLGRAGSSALYDATAAVAADAMTTAWATVGTDVTVARALVVKDFAGNMNSLNYNCSTDAYSAGTDSATTNTAQLAIPPTEWTAGSSITKVFGMALLKFTTIPTDAELQGIVSWCAYYWSRGYKTLPPWLVGRS